VLETYRENKAHSRFEALCHVTDETKLISLKSPAGWILSLSAVFCYLPPEDFDSVVSKSMIALAKFDTCSNVGISKGRHTCTAAASKLS
jgi:hypothetical protein